MKIKVKKSQYLKQRLYLLIFVELASLMLYFFTHDMTVFLYMNVWGALMLVLMGRDIGDMGIHLIALSIILFLFAILLSQSYIQEYSKPYYYGGSDDAYYERYAGYCLKQNYYAISQIKSDSMFKFHNSIGYIWWLTWLMRISSIFGTYHYFIPRMVNIFLWTIVALLVYKQEKDSMAKKHNVILFYCLGVFPNAMFIVSNTFRDTLITLSLYIVYYIWDRFKRSHLVYTVMATGVICYFSYYLRKENLVYIGIIIILSFIFNNKESLYMALRKRTARVLLIITVVGIVLLYSGLGSQIYARIVRQYVTYSSYIIEGASLNSLGEGIFRIPLFPLGLIMRIVYGLVTPIPISLIKIGSLFSSLYNGIQNLISLGTVLQILLIPYLFAPVRKIKKDNLVFWIFFGSIIITTFTFRHFIILYPFMFPVMIRNYFETSGNRRRMNLIAVVFAGLFGAMVYLLIK